LVDGKKPPEKKEEDSKKPGFSSPLGMTSSRNGLWKDRKRLVVARNASFPRRCLKRNEATDDRVTLTIGWSPIPAWAAVLLIIFGGWIVYLIAAMATRRTMTIECYISRGARTARLVHILVGLGLSAVGFVLMCVCGNMMAQESGSTVVVTSILLASVLLLLGGLIYAILGSRLLTATRMDEGRDHVWLKGVHPDFLKSQPHWDA